MPPRPQSLDEALRTGISLPTRSIYIVGKIDEDKFRLVQLGLDLLDREDMITTIILSSEGGYSPDGLAIYDCIKRCVGNVRILGTGCVQSMATIILQAGDERLLTRNCRVHLHEVSSCYERAPVSLIQRMITESKIIDDISWSILSERTGLSPSLLKDRYSSDSYFSAYEAVELGLADQVV